MPTHRFNVFQELPYGDLVHICGCDSLISAQQSLVTLSKSTPDNEFLIFDSQERKFVPGISKSASA
jgi:hypothetical protein